MLLFLTVTDDSHENANLQCLHDLANSLVSEAIRVTPVKEIKKRGHNAVYFPKKKKTTKNSEVCY